MTKSDHRHPRSPCPSCDAELDACSQFDDDRPPRAGDWTLCIYCVTWLRFTGPMDLREATAAEVAGARGTANGPEMDRIERAIRRAMREGRL